MTYAEQELLPLGFYLAEKENDEIGFARKIVLSFGHLKFLFECVCPAYPTIKGLGCPLHHDGPGGSWPIEDAKKIPAAIL